MYHRTSLEVRRQLGELPDSAGKNDSSTAACRRCLAAPPPSGCKGLASQSPRNGPGLPNLHSRPRALDAKVRTESRMRGAGMGVDACQFRCQVPAHKPSFKDINHVEDITRDGDHGRVSGGGSGLRAIAPSGGGRPLWLDLLGRRERRNPGPGRRWQHLRPGGPDRLVPLGPAGGRVRQRQHCGRVPVDPAALRSSR